MRSVGLGRRAIRNKHLMVVLRLSWLLALMCLLCCGEVNCQLPVVGWRGEHYNCNSIVAAVNCKNHHQFVHAYLPFHPGGPGWPAVPTTMAFTFSLPFFQVWWQFASLFALPYF